MKTIIKALLFLLIISSTTTKLTEEQKLKQLFRTELTAYAKDFNTKNWEGVADRIDPKLFDYMPKEKMVEMFKGMAESGMEMTLGTPDVKTISEVLIHENEKFCKIDYLGEITMKLSGEMLEMKEMLKTSFASAFGEKNITFNEKTNSFHINSIKSMLVVSPKDENNWKFIEFNKSKTKVLKMLVPKEILQKIAPEIELEEETVFKNEEVEEIEMIEEEEVMEEEEPPVLEKLFINSDKQPSFPGGEEKLYQYLGTKITYPKEAEEKGISGRVFVQFVIEKDGNMTDVKVVKGIGGGCDKEAIRVVKAMPNWIPGTQRGKKVRVRIKLPINFKIGKIKKK